MAISVCATLHASVSTSTTSGRRCKYTGQSVRALPIRLITVGKNRSRGVQLIVADYIGKLKHYCTVDDVQIKSNPKNARDVRAQVDDEDAAVMNLIRSDDWVVMLDEHGLDVGSEQMADLVGDAGNTGASRLSFCIGGPYGHGRQIRERANISIKLSSMVLNHQIALLVLMEQLYRTSDGTILSKDDIPPLVHLPSLKIFRVNLCFPTDELTTKLFCDLPVLEELFSICDNEKGTLNSFTLSLKRLKLVLDDKIDYQILIRTPRLKELDSFK